MSVTSKPPSTMRLRKSGSLLIASIMSETCLRTFSGVDFGTATPRYAPSTHFTPSSVNVGTSGNCGTRFSVDREHAHLALLLDRSEERRVGKECKSQS